MQFKQIKNFKAFLFNCDVLGDYNCIHIYKNFLRILSDKNIKLKRKQFQWLSEIQKRTVLNRMIDYFLVEGIIERDTVTGELKSLNN